MKKIFFLFLLSCSGYYASAQHDSSLQYFMLLYSCGEKWDSSKAYQEQPYFKEHSQQMNSLRKAGKIKIGGGYADKGMILLLLRDEKEARNLLNQDPSVQHKIFKVELFAFDPFYPGCIH